jgi:ABC-type amino acid transport system permease subunit
LRADYYRAQIAFLEEVTRKGIEQVSDQRKGQQEAAQVLRPGLKLTAAQ